MLRRDQQLVIGRVVGLHGIEGWLKIESYADPRENIKNYTPWQLDVGGQKRAVIVAEMRLHGKGIIVRFDGIDDRNTAAELVNSEISIDSNQLPQLARGEYYWRELIGLTVINRRQQELGQVESLFETGANDVLVVKKGQRECLIPYLPQRVITAVDLEKGRIQVDWEAELE